MYKTCRICGLSKNIVEFAIRSINNDKIIYRNECLLCKSLLDKASHAKNRITKPEHSIFISTKRRAKSEGIKFNLEEADIVIPTHCPILGVELHMHINYAEDDSTSVDRLIPSNGYVKGNCFIISYKANRMKQENTLEDFEKLIRYIKERI